MASKPKRLALILLLPSLACADAGLPVIMVSFPLMTMALVPVILLESWVIAKILGLCVIQSLKGAAVSNVLSTLVGLPLSWGLLLLIQFSTTGGRCGPGFKTIPDAIQTILTEAAWNCPTEVEHHVRWLLGGTLVLGFLAAFVVSVIFEKWVYRKWWPTLPTGNLWKASILSNALSYTGLIAFVVWILDIYANGTHSTHRIANW